MSLRFCVLGSSSQGNAIFVASPATRILIDAGFSGVETERRLAQIGETTSALNGVCLTHEHDDHTAGLAVLQRKYGTPLFGNAGTIDGFEARKGVTGLDWSVFSTGYDFNVGDLTLTPFSVPHDGRDPVGFVVRHENARIGIASDLGAVTHLVRVCLRGCGAVVLEANHDVNLLQNSSRPWTLKQRVTGRHGHLSNLQAAELIRELAETGLTLAVLAHLSEECNTPDAAMAEMRATLGHDVMTRVRVEIAPGRQPGPVYTLSEAR